MNEEAREVRMLVLNILKEGRIQVEEADKIINFITKVSDEKNKPTVEAVSVMAKEGVFKLEKLVNDLGSNIEKAVQNIGNRLTHKTETEKKESPERFSFFENKEIVSENIDKLILENYWGTIRVSGEERENLSLDLEKTICGKDNEEASERNQAITIIQEIKENSLYLYLPSPNPSFKDVINLDLKVPAKLSLQLGTISGDVLVYKMNAPENNLQIKTESGDIEVIPARFKFSEISSVSGDVHVAETETRMNIRTTSGNVELFGKVYEDSRIASISGDVMAEASVDDTLEISSGNGHIEFKQIANKKTKMVDLSTNINSINYKGIVYDQLRIRSNSGNITGRAVMSDKSRVEVSTTSGDISWRTDEDCGLVFSCESMSGDIFHNIQANEKIHKTQSAIKGVLKDGEAELILNTVSGDIKFHKEVK